MINDYSKCNSITDNLIKASCSELVNWYSIFTNSEESKVLEDEEFKKLRSFFECSILDQVAALTQISECEYTLCSLNGVDLFTGISIDTDRILLGPNYSLGKNLAQVCIERYGESLYQNIFVLAQKIFLGNLPPIEELFITTIFYIIHTSVTLFQLLIKTCFIKDGGKFNFANISDRVAIVTRYYTFLNNIMNGSGITITGFVDPEKSTVEECRFLAQLTGMPNGDVAVESIRIVSKSFKENVE